MMLGTRQAVRCRGSFHQGGLQWHTSTRWYQEEEGFQEITTPDFELAPDAVPGIAQVIVDIWTGAAGLDKIMDRNPSGSNKGMATQDAVDQATAAINAATPN